MNVLVIEDDARLRSSLRRSLEALGHQAVEASDGADAVHLSERRRFEVAVLDLRLTQEPRPDLLPQLFRLHPDLHIVVVTANGTIDTRVEINRRGLVDYLPEPFTSEQLRIVLDRIATMQRFELPVEEAEEQVHSVLSEVDFHTDQPQMRRALDVAFAAAPTEVAILLRGESGTGKNVLARAIHARSSRSEMPFITVHCPSLSAELLESELFGQIQGTVSGAVHDTIGKVAVAEGGTMFLDEIGDLPLALQAKLLRLLQERCYERVGESQMRDSNVRVLAATNRSLEAEIATGRFREDLFYLLNVIEVTLLPLRRRINDILPLAEHLLRFFGDQNGKPITGFDPSVKEALIRYPWPGNMRELRNAIDRSAILSASPVVELRHLPSHIAYPNQTTVDSAEPKTLDQIEVEHIRRVLASTEQIGEAATRLGINPSTLYRKRKKYGI